MVLGSIFTGYVPLASPNPILVTFEQMSFSQSQLSHFLIMPLPYRAF